MSKRIAPHPQKFFLKLSMRDVPCGGEETYETLRSQRGGREEVEKSKTIP